METFQGERNPLQDKDTPKSKDANPIFPNPMEGNHPQGHQWLKSSPHPAQSRTWGHYPGLVMATSQTATPNEPPLCSFRQRVRQQGPRNLAVSTAFRWIVELRGICWDIWNIFVLRHVSYHRQVL